MGIFDHCEDEDAGNYPWYSSRGAAMEAIAKKINPLNWRIPKSVFGWPIEEIVKTPPVTALKKKKRELVEA
jgi:hypothetical protein